MSLSNLSKASFHFNRIVEKRRVLNIPDVTVCIVSGMVTQNKDYIRSLTPDGACDVFVPIPTAAIFLASKPQLVQ